MEEFTLPADVVAYLTQAAELIAQEQGFAPASAEEAKQWMMDNFSEIAQKASELQGQFLGKVMQPDTLKTVSRVLGTKVWADVQRQGITARETQRYERIFSEDK